MVTLFFCTYARPYFICRNALFFSAGADRSEKKKCIFYLPGTIVKYIFQIDMYGKEVEKLFKPGARILTFIFSCSRRDWTICNAAGTFDSIPG